MHVQCTKQLFVSICQISFCFRWHKGFSDTWKTYSIFSCLGSLLLKLYLYQYCHIYFLKLSNYSLDTWSISFERRSVHPFANTPRFDIIPPSIFLKSLFYWTPNPLRYMIYLAKPIDLSKSNLGQIWKDQIEDNDNYTTNIDNGFLQIYWTPPWWQILGVLCHRQEMHLEHEPVKSRISRPFLFPLLQYFCTSNISAFFLKINGFSAKNLLKNK